MLPAKLNIEFRKVSADEWFTIHTIAHKTWPTAYGEMISIQQLNYMLDLIYSESSIRRQIENMRHEYIIGYQSGKQVGFASIEQHFKNANQLMIHKLYVLPEFQGRGLGKIFIKYITTLALDASHDILCLKVFHKNQKGIAFYKSIGFLIYGEEETDIGNGYEILDYVMTKNVRQSHF